MTVRSDISLQLAIITIYEKVFFLVQHDLDFCCHCLHLKMWQQKVDDEVLIPEWCWFCGIWSYTEKFIKRNGGSGSRSMVPQLLYLDALFWREKYVGAKATV